MAGQYCTLYLWFFPSPKPWPKTWSKTWPKIQSKIYTPWSMNRLFRGMFNIKQYYRVPKIEYLDLLTTTFLLFGDFLTRLLTIFLARFLTRFLARFLTRFLARVLTRFQGREETIDTVYSTTWTEKYSVQYYSDGKIYYTVLFLKTS